MASKYDKFVGNKKSNTSSILYYDEEISMLKVNGHTISNCNKYVILDRDVGLSGYVRS